MCYVIINKKKGLENIYIDILSAKNNKQVFQNYFRRIEMNKKLFRVVSFLLSAFCVMPMAACFGDGGEEIDETKTQLQVAFVDSGMGSAYIYERAARFEEAYKDWQGKDGKVGVQVHLTGKLDEFSASTLMSTMPYNDYDVYSTGPNYAGMQAVSYNGASILADITDVVTGKFYDDAGNYVRGGNGTKSLADRLYPEYRDYFNLGTETNPSYWAISYNDDSKWSVLRCGLF